MANFKYEYGDLVIYGNRIGIIVKYNNYPMDVGGVDILDGKAQYLPKLIYAVYFPNDFEVMILREDELSM